MAEDRQVKEGEGGVPVKEGEGEGEGEGEDRERDTSSCNTRRVETALGCCFTTMASCVGL